VEGIETDCVSQHIYDVMVSLTVNVFNVWLVNCKWVNI